MLKLELQYFEPTHWKRLKWCKRLKAGGKRDDIGWDSWMASPTQWRWVWVNSRTWWWIGRPGVLQSMGSQRVGHDWVSDLNWTDCLCKVRGFQGVWKERKETGEKKNSKLIPTLILQTLGVWSMCPENGMQSCDRFVCTEVLLSYVKYKKIRHLNHHTSRKICVSVGNKGETRRSQEWK